jgi:hypothetical protein
MNDQERMKWFTVWSLLYLVVCLTFAERDPMSGYSTHTVVFNAVKEFEDGRETERSKKISDLRL